jgi:cellulose synthase/poly-beta-1,6-N-acetylglucosamine synthase-like glycosyltransferase
MSSYQALVTASGWLARWHGAANTPLADIPTSRFVVLVPAHNEERLIGSALDALRASDYPAELVTVHVVADNCTDGTVAVARSRGVEVHERNAPDTGGKGPALQWLLARLDGRGDTFDAVVIIDADTLVEREFLRVMDAKIRAGAKAVQSYYAVREPEGSSAAGFRAVALAVRHYLRPLGRTYIGGTAGLHGNGMVFVPEILRKYGWSNHLTEDIELQLELLLDGVLVEFAPDAVVEAEMPATMEGSRTQHERWERGRLDLVRTFLPRLLRKALKGGAPGRIACLDAAADQVVPPFSITVVATMAWGGAALVLAAATRRRAPAILAITLAGMQAAYVLSGLRLASAPPAVYRSLLNAPRFVLWKVKLWVRMLGPARDVSWVRTDRNVGAGGPERTVVAPVVEAAS